MIKIIKTLKTENVICISRFIGICNKCKTVIECNDLDFKPIKFPHQYQFIKCPRCDSFILRDEMEKEL